jgi:hypothetical protein
VHGRNKWIMLCLLVAACAVMLAPFALRSAERAPSPNLTSLADSPVDSPSDTGFIDPAAEARNPLGAPLIQDVGTKPIASNDIVNASSDIPDAPANPDPAGPPEERAPWVVDLTRRNVQDNAPALQHLCDDTVASLGIGDLDTIIDLYSPDEIILEPLGSDWPSLDSVSTMPTVNVFLSEGSPVYFTYALATWTDAGIASQHTVCVPMRFIDGSWYLTGIDDTTNGLVFVTSVTL